MATLINKVLPMVVMEGLITIMVAMDMMVMETRSEPEDDDYRCVLAYFFAADRCCFFYFFLSILFCLLFFLKSCRFCTSVFGACMTEKFKNF